MNVRGRRSALFAAEWVAGGARERTVATELTEESVFVITESLPAAGTVVDLRLSLGGARRFEVMGLVVQVRLSVAPGSPAGFVVEMAPDERARRVVSAFVQDPSGRSRPVSMLHVEGAPLLRDVFAYITQRYFDARGGPVPLQSSASSVAAARSLVDARLPDVIVVERLLPDGSGEEVIHYARHRLGSSAFIVGIGLGSEGAAGMLDAGADIFLKKPIALPDLLGSVELLMQEDDADALGAA